MTFAQLYLTGKEAQENPDSYLVAEVQGNELRVTDVSEGGDDYDQYRALLPPVFTR